MAGKKWDIKRGYGVYKSVYIDELCKWIKEGRIKKGEVFIWTSGMSGWRRPEELDVFSKFFRKKRKPKPKAIKKKPSRISPVHKKNNYADIVIIDDEKDMCWLLENYLKKKHFNVVTATNGRSGLNMIEAKKPDIVLLDLRLKDVNGINILRKIKQLWPNIKVIIITAFGEPGVRKKALSLGAEGFIDKPFKPQEIIKKIKALT